MKISLMILKFDNFSLLPIYSLFYLRDLYFLITPHCKFGADKTFHLPISGLISCSITLGLILVILVYVSVNFMGF